MTKHGKRSRNWNNEARVYNYLGDPITQDFVATRIMDVGAASVLDIGCFKGALWGRLLQKGFEGRYTGFEIAGKPLAAACSLYGERSDRHEFIHADAILSTLPAAEFIAIGGFFFYLDDNQTTAYLTKVLQECSPRWILANDVHRCKNRIYLSGCNDGLEHGEFVMPVETHNSKRKYIFWDERSQKAVH